MTKIITTIENRNYLIFTPVLVTRQQQRLRPKMLVSTIYIYIYILHRLIRINHMYSFFHSIPSKIILCSLINMSLFITSANIILGLSLPLFVPSTNPLFPHWCINCSPLQYCTVFQHL